MNALESKCKKILLSITNGDVDAYKRLRTSIVADISDNDFMVGDFEDDLAIGKGLAIILDDMPHNGVIYKRVVLIALRSLIKIIISDKNDINSQTAIASALLLILFSENKDFVGGEYLVSKVRTTDTAAHQFIGMTCVFYWKYKFNVSKPILLSRTQQRLQTAISASTIDIPDISTRKKVIDFEYDNFYSMLHDLPLDVELKYPGVPFSDTEIILSKIQSLFNTRFLYFKKIESDSSTTTTSPNSANINNNTNRLTTTIHLQEAMDVDDGNAYMLNVKSELQRIENAMIEFLPRDTNEKTQNRFISISTMNSSIGQPYGTLMEFGNELSKIEHFLTEVQVPLFGIRDKLSVEHPAYINLSTKIVTLALDKMVSEFNTKININEGVKYWITDRNLPQMIELCTKMSSFDMTSSCQDHLNKQKETLERIQRQHQHDKDNILRSSHTPTNNSGCMVTLLIVVCTLSLCGILII